MRALESSMRHPTHDPVTMVIVMITIMMVNVFVIMISLYMLFFFKVVVFPNISTP
jgi:hypothetical protein